MKKYYIEIDRCYFCLQCKNPWVGIILENDTICFYCKRHIRLTSILIPKISVDKNTYDLLLGIAG